MLFYPVRSHQPTRKSRAYNTFRFFPNLWTCRDPIKCFRPTLLFVKPQRWVVECANNIWPNVNPQNDFCIDSICLCACSLITHGYSQNVVRTRNYVTPTPHASRVTDDFTTFWHPTCVISIHTRCKMEFNCFFLTFFDSRRHSYTYSLISNSFRPMKTRGFCILRELCW